MKIIKFGGKSLSNGIGIQSVINIIKQKKADNEEFVVVASARGPATDQLIELSKTASESIEYSELLKAFKQYQSEPAPQLDYSKEFGLLDKILEGVHLLGDLSPKVMDMLLSLGELISVRMLEYLLNQNGVQAKAIDSRNFLKTDEQYGKALVNESVSAELCKALVLPLIPDSVPVISGFIGSSFNGHTTTLGRNGSNYSAALIANFLNAEEMQNYTHVDGIYTANPDFVEDAKIIDQIAYREASELAGFGANILHAKTIIPLIEKNIRLRILNTFDPDNPGTLICKNGQKSGVKSISVKNGVSLINLEGKGLLGKVGVDARIFGTLGKENINIGLISQGSSERGIGFVVDENDAQTAQKALLAEFSKDIEEKDVNSISIIGNVSVISIVGQNLQGFSTAYQSLVKNNIDILLINNNFSGSNISLLIDKEQIHKAVNLIHSQIFGVAKNIHIAIFGKGTVGSSLIDQIIENREQILRRKETNLHVFAIAGSKKLLLDKQGIDRDWREKIKGSIFVDNIVEKVMNFAKENHYENLITIDNTASADFIRHYSGFIKNGFDLISSNKLANTIDYTFYQDLRKDLKKYRKEYLYETNVGAGLPLIDTIKLLHDSGENISRIKGVFSGSLSYIFNQYSESERNFSEIVKEAMNKGFTEPDPREDLSGNDVARKLLILARELELENELEEVNIENLIPENLRGGSVEEFLQKIEMLDKVFEQIRLQQEKNHVLRFIGDLHGNLQESKGILDVKLVSVPKNSALGQLSGSNSIFEIYTESYGDQPIVIQGAGAGAEVTARGVFGDLLRIAEKR